MSAEQDWIKMDITKAAYVRKEVDQVLQKLNDAVKSNDLNSRNQLVSSIQNRINDLESFSVKNNHGK